MRFRRLRPEKNTGAAAATGRLAGAVGAMTIILAQFANRLVAKYRAAVEEIRNFMVGGAAVDALWFLLNDLRLPPLSVEVFPFDNLSQVPTSINGNTKHILIKKETVCTIM